jgi:predicted transcriptional regulator
LKQISRVLQAITDGCKTSDEVSVCTGLSIAIASNYLSELASDGLIRRVKSRARRYKPHGPSHHVYAPVTK